MEILVLGLIGVGAIIYFLPTIVAAQSGKRHTGAIFVLNLFLGWTFLGWVASLVWAVADDRADRPTVESWPSMPQPSVSSNANVSARPQATWMAIPSPGQRVQLLRSSIVRVEPEKTARSTGELRSGTNVTVVRTSGGWAWVQTDSGEEGWVEL